jgi:hypothetical protein
MTTEQITPHRQNGQNFMIEQPAATIVIENALS